MNLRGLSYYKFNY